MQLAGQPNSYRGQWIEVQGQIRGLEKIALAKDHILGIDAYYVYWVKPTDSNRTPYCVYSADLAADLEEPGNQFLNVNVDTRITGLFFKLRTYEATNNQVETCPLIVADSIVVKKNVAANADQPTWSPPGWLIGLFFVGMPILAIAMAAGVYRSTQTNQRHKFHLAEREDQNLNELASLSGIKSEREKLRELYDQELPGN